MMLEDEMIFGQLQRHGGRSLEAEPSGRETDGPPSSLSPTAGWAAINLLNGGWMSTMGSDEEREKAKRARCRRS